MADATAEHRFQEVLALGFHLIEKYGEMDAKAETEGTEHCLEPFRVDIWGYLAVACAGLDLCAPESAFFCLERMKECVRLTSDKNQLVAAEARVRELLHLDTSVCFYSAKNDPEMVRTSQYFVDIFFAHMRGMFRKAEDLLLALVREHVQHSKCKERGPECNAMQGKILSSLTSGVALLVMFANYLDLFPVWNEKVEDRLRGYRILFDTLCLIYSNISRSGNFNLGAMERTALQLSNLDTRKVDWPTLHVYGDMATSWILGGHQDLDTFGNYLGELMLKAESRVDMAQSRTVADMMTSGLILSIFSRDLGYLGDPKGIMLRLDAQLIQKVWKFNFEVNSSYYPTDFRTRILWEVYQLLMQPNLQHSAAAAKNKLADTFWSKWNFDQLSSVIPEESKGGILVDRTHVGLSDHEKGYYLAYLDVTDPTTGERAKGSLRQSGTQSQRDCCLVRMLRSTNSFLVAAEQYGLERLGRKRRF
jgi:hypothetical protein